VGSSGPSPCPPNATPPARCRRCKLFGCAVAVVGFVKSAQDDREMGWDEGWWGVAMTAMLSFATPALTLAMPPPMDRTRSVTGVEKHVRSAVKGVSVGAMRRRLAMEWCATTVASARKKS